MVEQNNSRQLLHSGEVAAGAWNMIPHANIVELMGGEAFDWIAVDMEHTAHSWQSVENAARVIRSKGKDFFVRLPACDPVAAKKALDCGANGIIVPSVNCLEEAQRAVAIAKFPPVGIRGASLARCTDFGRNFSDYYSTANDGVLVAVMLEHVDAVTNAEAILSVPGVDASFIGPYDLSASMGLPGQLDHPEVRAAQKALLEACIRNKVAPGIHIVPTDPDQVAQRIKEGFRFIALGLDTNFILDGCRTMLDGLNAVGS